MANTLEYNQTMKYSQVASFLPNKRCYKACHDCKTLWANIQPRMEGETPIHFYRMEEQGAVARRFICNPCHEARQTKYNDNEQTNKL